MNKLIREFKRAEVYSRYATYNIDIYRQTIRETTRLLLQFVIIIIFDFNYRVNTRTTKVCQNDQFIIFFRIILRTRSVTFFRDSIDFCNTYK